MHRHGFGFRPLVTRLRAAGDASVPLGAVERRALLWFISAAVAVSVIIAAVDGFTRPGLLVLEILLSLAFLPALSFVVAVPGILLVLVLLSGPSGGEQQALLALAFSGGLVARCSTMLVQAVFTVMFLTTVAIVYSPSSASHSTASLVVLILVAAGAGMVGVILRLQVTRGRRARAALDLEKVRSAGIAADERRRIADDLHDVVAHDLTGIAMHAQLLARTDDAEERRRSQDAILAASRQALTDLRRVVNAAPADDASGTTALSGYDIDDAIETTRQELVDAGYAVRVEVDARAGAGIGRLAASTFERILREASTNIVKHAPGRQSVTIELQSVDELVRLRVWNSLVTSSAPMSRLPSGGYGTVRMKERTQVLDGSFAAGPHDGGWLLEAELPER